MSGLSVSAGLQPHALPSKFNVASSVFVFFSLLSRSVLGLVPALVHTLHPIEIILAGTIRTTEAASGAITEATGDPTTTAAETEAITSAGTTRTEEEEEAAAMVTRPIGRVAEGEAGTTATMTRTTTLTARGGAVRAPVRRKNARAAAAAPTTLIARLRGDLDVLGAPATPLGLGLPPHDTAAARASLDPRTRRTS